MNDPYKTLGISPNATDDEIKKAYRSLAKKYHPDNYANSPLADVASEKMKEVNEAYDRIQKERAGGASTSSFGGQNNYGSTGGYDGGTYSGSFLKVRQLINEGRFSEAEIILDSTAMSERGAEWNFLKGCVLLRRGSFYDAQKYIETAYYMDPSNMEYRSARQSIRNNASRYGQAYRTGNASECSACDMCSTLLVADCCCECMGGDLIRCC